SADRRGRHRRREDPELMQAGAPPLRKWVALRVRVLPTRAPTPTPKPPPTARPNMALPRKGQTPSGLASRPPLRTRPVATWGRVLPHRGFAGPRDDKHCHPYQPWWPSGQMLYETAEKVRPVGQKWGFLACRG